MSDAEDTVRYWLGEEFGGPVTGSDHDQFNAAVRGVLAELDAERAAHEATKADAQGWRNGQAQAQHTFDLLYADHQALKARLALAEAVCEHFDSYSEAGGAYSLDMALEAIAAWRAAK